VSHVGKVRDINEDNYCVFERDYQLFIVADGMGGHNAGEVASFIAVNNIRDHIVKYITTDMEEQLIKGIIYEAFNKANENIYTHAKENLSCDGMGTTATLALKTDSILYIGHVGDSRAYIVRDNNIQQITSDHSLVAELVRSGNITEAEAMRHPRKNIITRALGTEKNVKIDIFTISFLPPDILILCTDGLSNFVDKHEIEKIVLEIEDSKEICERLVSMANKRGGYDNITVLVAKYDRRNIESR
ncbi:MAG TPA: Stp1/IreP family PP2C-type Ser/Thr phosphatase, partial [Oscillospiraceae bacterium]|nr:Stp1/IreP family PP2C-type Ser/Thr phosphatase [Oscillospiraceae bacterium]